MASYRPFQFSIRLVPINPEAPVSKRRDITLRWAETPFDARIEQIYAWF
jgi:hypothetical protein